MVRTRATWALRVGLLVATFALALVAFRGGVGVSERVATDADLWTHTYWALGLFVLGGLDIGLPVGGPGGLRVVLWVAYFVAPLITTSAVIEGAIRVLQPEWLRRLALRDHVVVVGLGRLGMTFLEALREHDPQIGVLVVDRDLASADIVGARFRADTLSADPRDDATLDAMHLERARAVVLLTGDDLVNLEVGSRVKRREPEVAVVAHVADIATRRLVDRSDAGSRMTTFNSHRVAARGLHEDHLTEAFANTEPRDVVVIAGFGRFGQTTLEHLLVEARGELERAVVVDVEADRRLRSFRAQVGGTDTCAITPIAGDLDDPQTWTRVDDALASSEVEPLWVICTDDDGRNLRSAIAVREAGKSGPIFVRCGYRSAFTSELAQERDFVVLSVQGMLRRTMLERMEEWIAPRPRSR